MRNFPHLGDTSFPDLQNVNVYEFQNTFDYTRWNEDTKVKLCNVIWNSDYSDVVKFDTNEQRDSYFDNIQDYYAIELTQAARIVPQNYVKLPIPYDVMARYNYLFIDIPIATSPDMPLDYETSDGLRRWYFFIDTVAYLSPSSTQVFLSLDVWTNYQNDVEINYMMLERGHAPVYASDTESYLQNPIANSRFLLAPDVNFDNASIIRSSDYVPFGNGTKYVCVASTCAPEQIASLGTVYADPTYNPSGTITYSNTADRFGYQLQVNGLTMGNGRNYGSARTSAKLGASDDGLIANNLSVYAIPASDCYGSGTFFTDVVAQCPQFLTTVQACFVVDEDCIVRGTQYTIAGHTVYRCVGTKRNLLTKSLTQNDFKYPQELRRFAKLYTSPYAVLEVTDNEGTTFTINIEETSTVQVRSVVSVAFPYIDYRVYLDGIGGVGSESYAWVDLRGQSSQQEISNSDWFRYCFDWEIPTFALYMDGETAYQLANFNRSVRMGLNDALVGYHTAMRSANTAMENAIDAADTTLQNVKNSTDTARTNAYNSADTAKTNADNNADTMKANTDASADTAKTNADASADTMYTNVDNNCTTIRDNMDLTIANTIANEEQGISTQQRQTGVSNQMQQDIVDNSNQAIVTTATTQNETTAATTATAAEGQMSSGIMSGITGGAVAGAGIGATVGSIIPGAGTAVGGVVGAAGGAAVGAIGGIIFGAISGQVNAYYANANAAIVTQGNSVTSLATETVNGTNAGLSAAAATDHNLIDAIHRRFIYGNNNQLADDQTNNNNANDRTNANNTRTTEKANATRTQTTTKSNATNAQNTAKTNATNTKNTSRTNADNTYGTDRTNAQNSRDRNVDNSEYTRQVAELNAKEILENAASRGMAGINDARNAAPSKVCEYGGNPSTDYMQNRGIQIRVKTQSDSAIRQTGDMFARYGYALNQNWDVATSGLKLMRHFTYWKCADIWVDDRKSSNNVVQNFITKMFLQGVTVWNNPNEIGRVSIYDN